MNKEKEIEKLSFALIGATSPLGVKDLTKQFDYKTVAEYLIKAGYGNVKDAITEFSKQVQQIICECTVPDFNKDGKPISRFKVDGYKQIDNLKKKFCGEGKFE